MQRIKHTFEARHGKSSARAIADVTGANPHTVRAYLDGVRRPAVPFVRAFCEAAGFSLMDAYVALDWLPPSATVSPDPVNLAETFGLLASTVLRLEPHVRRLFDGSDALAPGPLAAAAAVLSDTEGARRFTVRLFNVVSGSRYPAITNVCAEFVLKAGLVPLDESELGAMARRTSMAWRPDPAAASLNPAYWATAQELRGRTYSALHSLDAGQVTWQGEPGTRIWADPEPAHILIQDPFGGVTRPASIGGWFPAAGMTLVVVGARYSAGVAAGALAQALGWQFVPVRSTLEVSSDGRVFPVARDQTTGRVLAWSSVARHIQQRSAAGDPWRAVVLLRPSALRGKDTIDQFAVSLLRHTPARVVYVRPAEQWLSWWAARQRAVSVTGRFDERQWIQQTSKELDIIESALGDRPAGRDLHLEPRDDGGDLSAFGPALPDSLMDGQARTAWTVLRWLDSVANPSQPPLAQRLLPGTLSSWLPQFSVDPDVLVPELKIT